MTSCAEWTGVLLSVLLKEAGVKDSAPWIVAEGTEEVKGASSIPMAKAMDDCLVAYGMNGEAIRPQNGFPLRLLVPGFEGIFNSKYLRRIKVVDRYYMTYNDYGHLRQDSDSDGAALGYQIGPKSVITFPSAGQQLPDRGFYEVSGLAWSGRGRHSQGRSLHRRRQALDGRRDSGDGASHGAYAVSIPVELGWNGDRAPFALHRRTGPGSADTGPGRRVLQRALRPVIQCARPGQFHSALENRERWKRAQWICLKFSRFCCSSGAPRWRSRPRMAWEGPRTEEEIRAWDISISPTGEELPPGRGTPEEGALVYRRQGCAGCHGATLTEGRANRLLKREAEPSVDPWNLGRILPIRSPYATTVWDYINRAMPLNREGTLSADEIYALTAYLLYMNDVIPEDQVLDAESLPKIEMPNRDAWAALPDWTPGTPRLEGYPH